MSHLPSHSDEFSVTFRGVRGTMPIANLEFSKFGGNTSCVEVMCGDKQLILDAGTGITNIHEFKPNQPLDILLSHTHIDHILGLMFLPALYDKTSSIRVWAGHLLPEANLFNTLQRLISPPLFPIDLNSVACDFSAIDFHAGESLKDAEFEKHGIYIHTLPLNHPDRATGYRIEYNNKSICYITDIEHAPGVFEPQLVEFIQNTDLLIYDSTYDDNDFSQYQGWGHSTWQYAIKLAEKAGVEQLSLFHHDPFANDIILMEREELLINIGMSVKLSVENTTIII